MKRAAMILAVILFAVSITVGQSSGKKATVTGPVYEGQELTVDLPAQEQFANIGSKIDGAGMCVFSSIEMAARSQGLEQMRGYRDWWASVSRGGGWPEQVDKSLTAWWKYKNITPIPYYQFQGQDPGPVMELIDKTGRMACITYGYGERYGRPIAHMVNCPSFRQKYGCVLDNNFVATPGKEDIFEWMDRDELVRRMKLGTGSAWVFCWLTEPCPPPCRAKPKER